MVLARVQLNDTILWLVVEKLIFIISFSAEASLSLQFLNSDELGIKLYIFCKLSGPKKANIQEGLYFKIFQFLFLPTDEANDKIYMFVLPFIMTLVCILAREIFCLF